MPRIAHSFALLASFAMCAATNSAMAGGYGPRPGYGHGAPARSLPPETRYRDPRYAPAPRPIAAPRAPRFGMPPDLIHAYLPRNTELPMYNEPPSRFPQR